MADRTRPTNWEEFDDLLTCAGDVEDMINALWLVGGNPDVPEHICGAIQTIATTARTRLNGLRSSLRAYMEDAKK